MCARSLAAGLRRDDRRRLSAEERGDAVADRGGELALGPVAHRHVVAVARRGSPRRSCPMPNPVPSRPTRWRRAGRGACAASLSAPRRLDVVGLGGEPDEDLAGRRALPELAPGCRASARARAPGRPAPSSACRRRSPSGGSRRRRPPSRRRRPRRAARARRRASPRRSSTRTTSTPGGGCDRAGPEHERDLGAARERPPPRPRRPSCRSSGSRGTGPGRSARGSGPAVTTTRRPARSPFGPSAPPRTASQDLLRLGHAARCPSSPCASGPSTGPDEPTRRARRASRRCARVAGCVPHARVHRRREHERAVVLEQRRRSAGRRRGPCASLASTLAVGGRDDRDVGLVGEADVEDLAGPLPQRRVDGAAGERRERVGADEPRRRPRSSRRVTSAPAPVEQPREQRGLVRGDAAGDTEQHPAAGEHVSRPRRISSGRS